jgi:hypothetical protein
VGDYGLRDDPGVRAARHRHTAKAVAHAEDLFEGTRQRARTGSAGEHKRAVDIEQDEGDQSSAGQLSLRTLPARGPLADGSSSKVTR